MRNLRKESLSSKERESLFLVFKPDLNLEHIINVDAANHLTGISSSYLLIITSNHHPYLLVNDWVNLIFRVCQSFQTCLLS